MYFYPTRRTGHVLPMIVRSPTFHKTHAYRAHLGELVDGLKAVVNWLRQNRGKFLVVEDVECAARRDLANGARVETVATVAAATLYKYAAVAFAFGVDLTPCVDERDTCVRMNRLTMRFDLHTCNGSGLIFWQIWIHICQILSQNYFIFLLNMTVNNKWNMCCRKCICCMRLDLTKVD